jgi:hypothetical protein
MAGREDEAVAVEPIWVLGVVPHDLVVQDVTHWSTPHGQTRSVTRVRWPSPRRPSPGTG